MDDEEFSAAEKKEMISILFLVKAIAVMTLVILCLAIAQGAVDLMG